MSFSSCDDIHCMSHCNDVNGAPQAHCKKRHKNKYGSSGKRRAKAFKINEFGLLCKVEQHAFISILKPLPLVKLYSPIIHMS